MSEVSSEELARNPIFAALSYDEQKAIAKLGRSHHYQKGDWITHYGDEWHYLFWVKAGKVSALKESHEGRSLIATTIKTGELFWGVAFFLDGAPMPVALVAEEASELILWPSDVLQPYIINNGNMAWKLAAEMITRMQQISSVVDSLAFQAIPGRLANLLLDRYSGSGEQPVARDMTLDQMAAHIGTTREMVCRALYKFADDGVININRTEFLISNETLLSEIAEKG